MAILINNFDVNISEPLDTRITANDLNSLNRIQYKYEGLLSYNKSEKVFYFFNGTKFETLKIDFDEDTFYVDIVGNPNHILMFNSLNSARNSALISREYGSKNHNQIIGMTPNLISLNLINSTSMLSIGDSKTQLLPLKIDVNELSSSIAINWTYDVRDVTLDSSESASVLTLNTDGHIKFKNRNKLKNQPIHHLDEKLSFSNESITSNLEKIENNTINIVNVIQIGNTTQSSRPHIINRFNIYNGTNLNEISYFKSANGGISIFEALAKNDSILNSLGQYESNFIDKYESRTEFGYTPTYSFYEMDINKNNNLTIRSDGKVKMGDAQGIDTNTLTINIPRRQGNQNHAYVNLLLNQTVDGTYNNNENYGLGIIIKDNTQGYSISRRFSDKSLEIRNMSSFMSGNASDLATIKIKPDNSLILNNIQTVTNSVYYNDTNTALNTRLVYVDDINDNKVNSIKISELNKNSKILANETQNGFVDRETFENLYRAGTLNNRLKPAIIEYSFNSSLNWLLGETPTSYLTTAKLLTNGSYPQLTQNIIDNANPIFQTYATAGGLNYNRGGGITIWLTLPFRVFTTSLFNIPQMDSTRIKRIRPMFRLTRVVDEPKGIAISSGINGGFIFTPSNYDVPGLHAQAYNITFNSDNTVTVKIDARVSDHGRLPIHSTSGRLLLEFYLDNQNLRPIYDLYKPYVPVDPGWNRPPRWINVGNIARVALVKDGIERSVLDSNVNNITYNWSGANKPPNCIDKDDDEGKYNKFEYTTLLTQKSTSSKPMEYKDTWIYEAGTREEDLPYTQFDGKVFTSKDFKQPIKGDSVEDYFTVKQEKSLSWGQYLLIIPPCGTSTTPESKYVSPIDKVEMSYLSIDKNGNASDVKKFTEVWDFSKEIKK